MHAWIDDHIVILGFIDSKVDTKMNRTSFALLVLSLAAGVATARNVSDALITGFNGAEPQFAPVLWLPEGDLGFDILVGPALWANGTRFQGIVKQPAGELEWFGDLVDSTISLDVENRTQPLYNWQLPFDVTLLFSNGGPGGPFRAGGLRAAPGSVATTVQAQYCLQQYL